MFTTLLFGHKSFMFFYKTMNISEFHETYKAIQNITYIQKPYCQVSVNGYQVLVKLLHSFNISCTLCIKYFS